MADFNRVHPGRLYRYSPVAIDRFHRPHNATRDGADPNLTRARFVVLAETIMDDEREDEFMDSMPEPAHPLKELIRARLEAPHTIKRVRPESVASILEREVENTIQNWLNAVEQDAELTCVPLSRTERTGHLPKLLQDLVVRLQLDSGLPAPISVAARDHGEMRRQQGYTAPMVVEESRILQVSIFSTLQRNLCGVDFSRLLPDVVTIADEVDSQLKQAMFSYVTPTLKSRTVGLAG